MEEKYIVSFEEIRKEDVAAVGGKGANLGEMTNAGIPVPPGVVLTAFAYDRYMEENGIDTQKIMRENADTGAVAKEIRNAILAGNIPDAVMDEIRTFYDELEEQARVAVRSSATAEDLEDASFAGQQETYLNVRGREMLFQKVKECYASLWGDRAVSYRRVKGYDKEKVSLAVVIQQMIESDSAGVLFTKNPAGNTDDMLINASYGLGEAVVSGLVSPDEYVCTRDGRLKKATIGSKKEQIVYGEQGTEKVSVNEDDRKRRTLDDKMIARLVSEALRIETHYGQPMDIEWAVRDGKIYILQARSITTIHQTEERRFTEQDFEALPRIKKARGAMRESVLFNMEKTPMPYYPLDHDFGGEVGIQKEKLFGELGLQLGGKMYPIDEDGISLMATGGVRVNGKVFRIPRYVKQMSDYKKNMRDAKASLEDCKRRFSEIQEMPVNRAGEAGYVLEQMRRLIGDTAYGRFLYALFPGALLSRKLDKYLKKVRRDLHPYDLVNGLDYVTANINRELSEIAKDIRAEQKTTELVLNGSYAEITAENDMLKKRFEDFFSRYGNKEDFNCYCFAARSWNEDPDRFIRTLRPMLKSRQIEDLSVETGKKKQKELLKEIREALGDKDFESIKPLVRAFRYYHYIREESQYLWESEFAYCRKTLDRCAELLGCEKEDLLYLFAEELFAVCQNGELTDSAKAGIARRKEKRPLAEAYWNKCMVEALASDDDQIKGISGSIGEAKGRVCLVNGPEEFDKLKQGDILVCTLTDPEWTPLFTLAAGVVVDTGGTLSHAAIVAREYGIPAVLATGDATKKLRDGELVIVDGTKGVVTVCNRNVETD